MTGDSDMLQGTMRPNETINARFPVANCANCGKNVLVAMVLNDRGDECRVCAHCDAPIEDGIEFISATELESTGYTIGERPRSGGCGCGSGGGCSIRKN